MKRGNKVVAFKQKAVKIIDRTQEEIFRDRLQKRNDLLIKLRKKRDYPE